MALSFGSVAQPSFTADTRKAGAPDVDHVFELTVRDSDGRTDTDKVTIRVTPPFAAPVADSGGDQRVESEPPVTLDGSGSTGRDGMVEFYSWTRGDPVTLTLFCLERIRQRRVSSRLLSC